MIAGPFDERIRDRIIRETAGNPLALLELPRGRNADRAGRRLRAVRSGSTDGSHRADASPRRVERMPAATQRLLLIAAAEPIGDAALLFAAADRHGARRS